MGEPESEHPTLADFRVALTSSPFDLLGNEPSWDKADPDLVVRAMFDRMVPDRLWERVDAFDENSHLALEAIGSRYFKENADLIRTELGDEFKQRAVRARDSHAANQKNVVPTPSEAPFGRLLGGYNYYSLSGQDAEEAARRGLVLSALEILARNPSSADRDLFLRFLPDDPSNVNQVVACLRGIAAVGLPDDRERLKPFLSSNTNGVVAAASHAYLKLSSNPISAAKDILSDPSEQKVWAVIAEAVQNEDDGVWPVLEPLLRHENDDIRRMVCYFAARKLKRRALQKLLDEYMNPGHYYYNVVVLLDRALYAPASFREQFLREELDHFKKWQANPKTSWAGQIE